MKIKIFDNKIDNIILNNQNYPIKENMYIKVNGYKIKGLHNLKLFFKGLLVSEKCDKIEIGYLGEENK